MTKPTQQQQRREKKKQCKQTHNNSDNYESHVSEHEEFVSSNIKYVYPNVDMCSVYLYIYKKDEKKKVYEGKIEKCVIYTHCNKDTSWEYIYIYVSYCMSYKATAIIKLPLFL